ncbi:branched-chain amino acid ABC transporter permease [Roseiterribacter gracilis]|uniref:Branched-chain amino acid ABC transporter permease n=1 Tax=Roseiterribacter gracilis TaxID=2812848 RepID=A0A8S8XAK6_9PROT|nr:branched-chain amino acid ABC transporter permease [Rhodospirillales bacterium TMPK1]
MSYQALMAQLAIGVSNGAFYAMLSLGLAVIFGMLNVVNFAHGAVFMLGAFVALFLKLQLGLGYYASLILVPIIVGAFGVLADLALLKRLRGLDPLYGLLLTFGMTLVLEGIFRYFYGSAGVPYSAPEGLVGAVDLGFMIMPLYRFWVIVASAVVCFGTWYAIERTRLGAYLRAATENATLTQSFGINVPVLLTLTYGLGVALAGFAGVLAAPIYSVNPLMGSNLIIVVFAVVVIGGMGSILGAIVSGFALGILEGFTKVFYPEASNIVVFVVMAIVLLVKPAGLFGRAT